ncbi:recombinase family protein [Echinicola marina]|nr:recombinase family protein [Echinicola marina]
MGIYREDFSAKSFNRPEWKKLIAAIKGNKGKKPENILFVKWDRFSRNIEYAYEMIGILRNLNTQAVAIDQPIDFDIPESSVMLAVYLSIPEAENNRRALNTSNGMRRARQAGRYPGKAPLGYINQISPDGKKFIAPKHPEADLIIWSFQQLAKRSFTIEEVRRMACTKGLKCGKSNFWKLIRNPAYCGIVTVPPRGSEEMEFVKALHKPLISEELFNEVQASIKRKTRPKGKTNELKKIFPLRGYLTCPLCGRKLTGSVSKGSSNSYPYYHCLGGKCKARFNADRVNSLYNEKLEKLVLKQGAMELLKLILKDVNVSEQQSEYLRERRLLLDKIDEQEILMTKARKLYINDKIEFEDFSELKKEYNLASKGLKEDLDRINVRLHLYDKYSYMEDESYLNIFSRYRDFDIGDQRKIINLIMPGNINTKTRDLDSLVLNNILSKILTIENNQFAALSAQPLYMIKFKKDELSI